MSDHITSLRWLGNHIDADAANQGIGQGSEGARICWNAAIEIESLPQQLSDSRKHVVMLRDMLNYAADTYDSVWTKNMPVICDLVEKVLAATEPEEQGNDTTEVVQLEEPI